MSLTTMGVNPNQTMGGGSTQFFLSVHTQRRRAHMKKKHPVLIAMDNHTTQTSLGAGGGGGMSHCPPIDAHVNYQTWELHVSHL